MAEGGGLDQFLADLGTTDAKKKLTTGQNIINYLGDPAASIECEDTGSFVDQLVPWMQSSNFKVSQNGLDIIGFLIDRLASDFKPYLNTVLTSIVDRLGDTRESVREKANIALCKLMDATVTPQQLFEKLIPHFSHKNGKVREELPLLLQNTLNAHGAQTLSVSKFIPSIVAGLSDSQAAVRDACSGTLVEIYRHVGERVRADLQRKQTIPSNKLASLMVKFDEVRTGGNMMPTATLAVGTTEGRDGDERDGRDSAKSSKSSRSSSVPARERKTFATPKPPSAEGRTGGSGVRRAPSVRHSGTGGAAGAVDEESFISSFEDCKKVTIFSGRGLEEELSKVHATLSTTGGSGDWKQRIEALQMVRSLLIAGAGQFEELTSQLKALEYPFESCVKDLRSQVVRECCITLAFMSQQLHHKVDRFLEFLLPPLINLIQNSAKVMATSGLVCLRFIIQNTFSPRFLPIICQHVSSKSKEIRRHICEFLDQLLHSWPTHSLEKHVAILQEAIKKGVSDADPDARTFARKAYWGFADHFKDQADVLLNALEPNYRRVLQGEMSNSSSSNSLNLVAQSGQTLGRTSARTSRSRQSSVNGSQEDLIDRPSGGYRSATLGRKASGSGIPKWSASPAGRSSVSGVSATDSGLADSAMTRSTLFRQPSLSNGSPRHTPPGRSNSAIDATAARRAQVRQQYSQRGRLAGMSGQSIAGRARKSSEVGGGGPAPGLPTGTPDRNGRARSRGAGGVSQSQPGSRSASPSSIKSYHTYFNDPTVHSPASPFTATGGRSGTSARKRSGIPRSTGTSREASPSRYGANRGVGVGSRRPPATPHLTERILRQSREAESALADALSPDSPELRYPDPIEGFLSNLELAGQSNHLATKSPRKRSTGPFDQGFDNSDESETSSLCSEKSFDYTRGRPSDDITDIIANCASTHWADRKDGLIGLQCFFRDGRMLSGTELRRITDIFTKMFMDAHTKVFALFLETLCELVSSHKADLYDWLYVLLTRLLNKLGADLLGSVVHKINRTLDVVRESFSYEEQLAVIFKFLVDQTQTPNSKVKLATLQYLRSLVTLVESADVPTNKDSEMALAKIITWTSEPKSADIRRAAHQALVSMFNTHTPQMTLVLGKLPQVYQDSAAELLDKQITQEPSSTAGKAGPHKPGVSPMKPRGALQPAPNNQRPRASPQKALGPDDSENMNPDEVNKSLRLTANAIQNYSFEKVDKMDINLAASGDLADEKDSGISQVSLEAGLESSLAALDLGEGGGRNRRPVAAMDDMLYGSGGENIQSALGFRSLPRNLARGVLSGAVRLPEQRASAYFTRPRPGRKAGRPKPKMDAMNKRASVAVMSMEAKKLVQQDPRRSEDEAILASLEAGRALSPLIPSVHEAAPGRGEGESGQEGKEDMTVIQEMITTLQSVKAGGQGMERRACMTQLIRMARSGTTGGLTEHFRTVLRVLLENLEDSEGSTRALVFGVLTEMMKQEALQPGFHGFTELVILKVLQAHKDQEKDVVRAAEACAATMAGVLPTEMVVRVLNPIVKTGDFPVNQAAIKMLTKLVERQTPDSIEPHLSELMPGLLKAYDNVESSVRKAAVFCIVSLHQLVGEATLQPHLDCLNGSKMKLLSLYIKRAQAQSNGASPRNTPVSS